MVMERGQRLVIRGNPEPGESFKGYCLRLSEANCYSSLGWLLSNEDRTHPVDRFTITGASVRHVAEIARAPVEAVSQLGGVASGANHVLAADGRTSLPFRLIDHRHPKVCPACLAEGTFLRSL